MHGSRAWHLDRLAGVPEEAGGRVATAQRRLAAGESERSSRRATARFVATELGPVDVLQGMPQIPPFSQLQAEAVCDEARLRPTAGS